MRLGQADTRPGREVFFVLAGSGGGGPVESRLVAWRPSAAPCRQARALFRYPPAGGRPARPRRADFQADYHVSLGNFAPRRPGKEIRLEEWYTDENDSLCCPTILRRSFYGYDAERDKHRRYRKVVKRNQEY